MRMNEPVTQREFFLDLGVTLMSTTDLQGNITYVNEAFLQASGFTREELVGQPHNVVRHPDMPREAFADMWSTLRLGHAWSALVKNRRKDGDHYWVRANATPVHRGGQLVGYMSVRTTPGRDEVEAAEGLYERFRGGHAKGWRFHQGLVVRSGLLGWLSWGQRMPVAMRLRCLLLAVFLFGAAGAAAIHPLDMKAALWLGGQFAVLLATMWLAQKQVVGPMQTVLAEAEQLASGLAGGCKLLHRVDEVGRLQHAVHQAGLNLKALLDDVQVRATLVSDASREIAVGNDDLSARTEEAASSLQQTAASMEEFGSSMGHNAQSVAQAARQALDASAMTLEGSDAVRDVVTNMQAISESSRRMADIIGVIDGIAFQTNILALNAAVEAARAGEQGRGFAVVAGEVRSLAQRSASAAREIRDLIERSQSDVAAGVRLVDSAGTTLVAGRQKVREVSGLIEEIGSVTLEQTGAVAEVNVAVDQLDQMTQQNAALVEQIAAASRSLQYEARRLQEAIGAFV